MTGGGWTLAEAVSLCARVEMIAPHFGCHVALTGGTLYKFGERKDVDLLFYRIRQEATIDREGLLDALVSTVGIVLGRRCGWVRKAALDGRELDLFFPELDEAWEPDADRGSYGGRGS